ncbi:MAG: hypothetical protein PHR26_01480 [Candidatus ainarchaeum sp.]|nr:hypothetical protein [Candidatus ainarchaeum sp.]MDD3976317.1 hypothetical protein [Candidatus ainarchaeum sp.]
MVNTLVEVSNATITPLQHIWHNIIYYLPGFIGAIIVAIIGFLIGLLIGYLIEKALIKWKLDSWVTKNDFSHVLLHIKLSKLIGNLFKWGVFIAFLAPAASLIKLDILATFITKFALWMPNLIFAIILVIFGLILSKVVAKNIHVSKEHKFSKIIADIIQAIIIILFVDVALKQIGVKIAFIETIILLIIGGVVLAIAIALGIGMSAAIRDHSSEIFSKLFPKKK